MRLVLLFKSIYIYTRRNIEVVNNFEDDLQYFSSALIIVDVSSDDYSMLVAIQYISCSQCSAQASLSEYSELQYSSAATNHLHTISE